MNPKTTFLIIPDLVHSQKMNSYKKEFSLKKHPELSTFAIFSSEAIKTTTRWKGSTEKSAIERRQ
jgi:hypothetical protein